MKDICSIVKVWSAKNHKDVCFNFLGAVYSGHEFKIEGNKFYILKPFVRDHYLRGPVVHDVSKIEFIYEEGKE